MGNCDPNSSHANKGQVESLDFHTHHAVKRHPQISCQSNVREEQARTFIL